MEIKACPVCEKLSVRFYKGYEKKEKVSCCNPDCPIKDIRIDYAVWQNRPSDNELQKKVNELLFLLQENKKIYCSKDGDFPDGKHYNDTGSMVVFQIEGETHIGGYIAKTNEWFSTTEECFNGADYTVYWKYLDDLKFYYDKQKENNNERNNSS